MPRLDALPTTRSASRFAGRSASRFAARFDGLPTAPLAATGLIAGFGVAVASGNRPLGGLVMAGFGLSCMALWRARSGTRTMWKLTGVGFGAFVVSHGLGLAIGAWPSVIVCAAGTALACERLSDAAWRH